MAEEKKTKGGKGKFLLGAILGVAAGAMAGKIIKDRKDGCEECDCDDCNCENCKCKCHDEDDSDEDDVKNLGEKIKEVVKEKTAKKTTKKK